MRQIDQKLLALVLKSKPLKEGDLLVTILTKQEGKLVLLAKGVRKINSKRRCFLESGNLIKAQIIPSRHLPILELKKKICESVFFYYCFPCHCLWCGDNNRTQSLRGIV